MRTLITGITGFVGRHLACALTREGHHVWGCALGLDGAPEGVELADVDLRDAPSVARLVRRAAPDALVHLGGLSHVGASFARPGAYFEVNVLGTRNVLAAAAAAAPHARLLVASSAEVYGSVPEAEQPIDEQRACDPRSPYAWSKAAAEVLAADAGAMITRAFNIVGPGQDRSFALPSFAGQLAAIAAGRAPARLQVGDLSPRRDFLHIDDAVDAYRLLLAHGKPGGVYNLASGTAHAVADMLAGLRVRAGLELEVVRDEARVRPTDMPLLVGDAGRLRSLGWRPQHTVDDALDALWREAREASATGEEGA